MSNYRVWAPYAAEVELLTGDPSSPEHHPMTAADGGWFEHVTDEEYNGPRTVAK